jgi:haloacetate dehalogenase
VFEGFTLDRIAVGDVELRVRHGHDRGCYVALRLALDHPDAWYGTDRQRDKMEPEAFEGYLRAVHNPATVHAMCEDYRAGLGIDRRHDDESRRTGARVACPTHFLWSAYDDMEDLYGDPLAIWSEWTTELGGTRIESGHHMAEEAPEAVADAIRGFLCA